MRKTIIFSLFMVLFISLSAYNVNDLLDQDYSWTDSNGEDHSIFELVDSNHAVLIFWGGYG